MWSEARELRDTGWSPECAAATAEHVLAASVCRQTRKRRSKSAYARSSVGPARPKLAQRGPKEVERPISGVSAFARTSVGPAQPKLVQRGQRIEEIVTSGESAFAEGYGGTAFARSDLGPAQPKLAQRGQRIEEIVTSGVSAFAEGYGGTAFARSDLGPAQPKLAQRAKAGAGSRDRTGILSLEGCCTTIVLYPRQN